MNLRKKLILPSLAFVLASNLYANKLYTVETTSLEDAISKISKKAEIPYLVDTTILKGKKAKKIKDIQGLENALKAILEGTELEAIIENNMIMIKEKKEIRQETIALNDVTVTSEKLERNLQDTTTSLSVINSKVLKDMHINNLKDTFSFMGNVNTSDWLDSGFVIRGINSEGVGGPSGTPLGTLYIDGVAQTQGGTRRGPTGMWDVEMVEVAKGPQSTLRGKSSLAGAISINTKDPSFEEEAAIRLGMGNSEYKEAALMVNVPINENIAFRVAGEYNHSEGQINYPTYKDLPRYDERNDDDYWQGRAKLLYANDDLKAVLTHIRSYNSPSYDDVMYGSGFGYDLSDKKWTASWLDWIEARSTKTNQTSLDTSYFLKDNLELKLFLSHVDTEVEKKSINLARNQIDTQKELVQELSARYTDDNFEGIIGLHLSQAEDSSLRDNKSELNTSSIFGESEWQFIDDFKLITGFRYEIDNKKYTSNDENYDEDFNIFLPKIGIKYQIEDKQNIGFVVQKGYRPGGVDFDDSNNESYKYDEENAINYELSYRSLWNEDTLRFNANMFYMKWKEQQVSYQQDFFDPYSDRTVNAGESHLLGGELELAYEVNPSFNIFSSIGIVKTEFDDFKLNIGSEVINFAGKSFPQSPEINASLGARYNHPSGFYLGGNLNYNSGVYSRNILEGSESYRDEKLSSFAVVNLQTGYRFKNYSINFWVDNLFDKEYITYRDGNPYANSPQMYATMGKERRFGINIEARF
ncbi:hypothetical protein CP965_03265 [Halarcobacter mediterraneus]|uniref:TonB-dependent receptor n=1 Tax=Halarcobacter mediterraneus TaxID=2023153 RepID=A0A4Q1B0E7_9BACT|nr:TonB-dependent receptor [Halarcobacter mediterraneus]RXK14482.1 hypothetical protein CP965_03265 [Halarcobacter mediterraneus]